MPRTPLPADSVERGILLTKDQLAFLKATGKSPQAAVNDELDFLRTLSLVVPRYGRRLEAVASRRGIALLEFVSQVLWAEAARYPPARVPPGPAPGQLRLQKVQLHVTGPNDAWVVGRGDAWRLEYSEAVRRGFDFCRTYGLPPHLLAALAARAEAQGDSLRAYVQDFLMSVADGLPDAPARPATAAPARAG